MGLTLRSLKISYQIDNGPVSTIDWTGIIVKCDQLSLAFTTANTSTGAHVIKMYTSLPNGLDDQYKANDTLVKTFNIFAPVATPVTEGFEGNNFPSLNWGVQNVTGVATGAKILKVFTIVSLALYWSSSPLGKELYTLIICVPVLVLAVVKAIDN